MDLKSGQAFWALRNGLMHSFPRLRSSLETEVAVIGTGITGAMIAEKLVSQGHDVVVLDRRESSYGSTSVSTALIQYEIDTSSSELSKLYGESAAISAYRACCQAIDTIAQLDQQLKGAGSFAHRPSIYFASREEDAEGLREEYELRAKHGFPVELWDRQKISQHFDVSSSCAILSFAGGELDPYAMSQALLAEIAKKGKIFDRTDVTHIDWDEAGCKLHTDDGHTVSCKTLIVAGGYESLNFLPSIPATLHSTFALATEPVTAFPGWFERCLIWETARPYLYMRTTQDDRIIAGGKDIRLRKAWARDFFQAKKCKAIEARVREYFPRIDFCTDFTWSGVFAETFDGLPFIGPHPERPGAIFALCFGGNGITYSAIAAEMIAAKLRHIDHPLTELFGFSRSKHHR